MIYFVINKKSGSYSEDLEMRINTLARKYYGINFMICGTVSGATDSFLPDLPEIPVKGDIIVAVGGDGTINLCLHYIRINKLQKKVNLGIIPRGTGNNMLYALKLSKLLSKSFRILQHGSMAKLQYGTINQTYSFFNCSVGFSSYVVKNRKTRSRGGYVYDILANYNYVPGVSKIIHENGELSGELFHGYFMNTSHYASIVRFQNNHSSDCKLRFFYSEKVNIFKNLEGAVDVLRTNENIQSLQKNLQLIDKRIQLFKEEKLLKQVVSRKFELYPSPDCFVEIDGDVLPWQEKYCIEYAGKVNVICGVKP